MTRISVSRWMTERVTRAVAVVVSAVMLGAGALAVAVAGPASAAAPAGQVVTYSDGIGAPIGIANGPDGNVWFTNSTKNSIGRVSPAGTVTSFADPSMQSPSSITAGPDGNLWFTNYDNSAIGRISPAGVVASFSDAGFSGSYAIAAGPDGNLWFTSRGSNKIGRITPSGVITLFSAASVSEPLGIVSGPDGALWFANFAGNTIGRITTAGAITSHADASISGPLGIAVGPDANLWFTNASGSSIGRIVPATGVVANFTGDGIALPTGITAGPNGALWFTNYFSDSIGEITTNGVVSRHPGTGIKNPARIIWGPDERLWFTNHGNNSIGQLKAATVDTFSDPLIAAPYDITSHSDGNLWFTNSGSQDGLGMVTPAGAVTVGPTGGQANTFGILSDPDGNLWATAELGLQSAISNLTLGASYQPTVGGSYRGLAYGDLAVWAAAPGNNKIAGVKQNGDLFSYGDATISQPQEVAAGDDGALWFTNFGNNTIGRVTTAGVISNFADGTISQPVSIVAGPDGALWFTNSGNGTIGRITTAGVVSNFVIPSVVEPVGITVGPDGNLWFTDHVQGSVVRLTPTGGFTIYPSGGSAPRGITTGPDGNLWFTLEGSNAIGRLTPEVVSNIAGASISRPTGVVAGPDGNTWFTNNFGNSIGRVTPAGAVTNFTAPGILRPFGIAAGPDGNLWFTNSAEDTFGTGSSIGRITPAGAVTLFTDPNLGVPTGIAAGPDGNMWFALWSKNGIGRITPAGVIQITALPTATNRPLGITAGADGALWFTNQATKSIGRITTAGAVTMYTHPSISGPQLIASGPDGNLWFTNYTSSSIGRITPAGVVSNFTDATISGPSGIAAGPDGNLWFASRDNSSIGRITPAGVVAQFLDPGMDAPFGIAPGSDGNMWFTNSGQGGQGTTVGRIGTATAPGAPTAVVGTAGNAQVAVAWAAPASTGGSPITGYTVTSSPESKTCTWTTGALSCVVPGLTNGKPYTFSVKATNALGHGPASWPSAVVTPGTVPTAPITPVAAAAKGSASVTWAAPASNGGFPVTGYTVTSAPEAKTCTTAGPLTCTVAGLTAGTAYTFTVKATNAAGSGAASVVSNSVVPWDGAGYHPVTPSRILDSRGTTGGWFGKLLAGTPKELQVTGLGGGSNVPATATAVVMNVTVTGGTAGSFVSAWPTGSPQPTSSNLNFGIGETIPNLVTVKLGPGGKVSFANAVGGVDVIADVVGFYDDGNGPGDLFTGITPTRLLDSRTPNGGWGAKLVAGTPRDLVVRQPANAAGVPATATAIVANVTVTGGTAGSFVSVWPSGLSQPNVSNLNFGVGQTIPNLVVVKVGTNGAVRFANAIGGVDVIVDVVGYFDPSAGSRFHAINPTRILDDRVGKGLSGPWGPGQTRALPVAGAVGTNVPAGATGLVANVTATGGTAGSFVTVFPDGVTKPNSSNLNFGIGQTIPNLVTVKVGANGKIALANALGNVDLIADAVGYYAPT